MISVYDFYRENKDKYALKLRCGEEGLKKPATWLYMAEDKRGFDFIRGGELTVTTGMAVSGSRELQDFIERLISRRASGLIINTGRYIKESDITEEIRVLCNNQDFALFTMPWEMHLSDLMQSFANLHFISRQREENMKIVLPALCLNGDSGEKHRDFLISQGLMPGDRYAIGLCRVQESTAQGLYLPNIIRVNYKGQLIVLFHGDNRDRQIKTIATALAPLKLSLGIGPLVEGYGEINRSYTLATGALRLAEYTKMPILSYEEAGIYTLLMNTEPKAALEFSQRTLGRLEDEELITTLEMYIACKGSLKAAAEGLNCHRNTVLYRMERIRELTACELTDGEELSRLYLAIAAKRYGEALGHIQKAEKS